MSYVIKINKKFVDTVWLILAELCLAVIIAAFVMLPQSKQAGSPSSAIYADKAVVEVSHSAIDFVIEDVNDGQLTSYDMVVDALKGQLPEVVKENVVTSFNKGLPKQLIGDESLDDKESGVVTSVLLKTKQRIKVKR